MRQQQHHATLPRPLILTAEDELVDDALRGVGKVAELGLPDDQRAGRVNGEAVLEAQHRKL